jgi:hypothetical protein
MSDQQRLQFQARRRLLALSASDSTPIAASGPFGDKSSMGMGIFWRIASFPVSFVQMAYDSANDSTIISRIVRHPQNVEEMSLYLHNAQ